MEETAATETVTEGLVLILVAFRQDANFNQDCYDLRICFARQFLSHLGRSASTRHFAALQKSTFRPNVLGNAKKYHSHKVKCISLSSFQVQSSAKKMLKWLHEICTCHCLIVLPQTADCCLAKDAHL